MGILPFFLENAEFGNKRKKNLPHPEAQVRGGGCQQQVDRVADLPFEEVAIQSKVAFEVADSWFDRCRLRRCGPAQASALRSEASRALRYGDKKRRPVPKGD